MWDHEEKATLRELFSALLNLVHLASKALQKYLTETQTVSTTLKGDLPMNYQLNTQDTVVVTLSDTNDATGAVVTIDPGSITAVSSDPSDTVTVNADGTVTLTAGPNLATGKTVTVNATTGGVASKPWVGTYDVIAATAAGTTLSGTFGTEVGPGGTTAPPSSTTTPNQFPQGQLPGPAGGTAPVNIPLPNGSTIVAGTPLPAGTHFNAATGELINTASNTLHVG
jgi:hypothetical protein